MAKEERPKLDIPISDAARWLQRIIFLAIIASFVLVGMNYSQLPDQIPVHFDFSGQPDDWGSKIMIWVLPIIMSAMVALFLWLCQRPHQLNYPVKITPENAAYYYKKTQWVLRWLSFLVSIMTIYVTWKTIQIASGKAAQVDSWFLWIFLSLIGASMVVLMIPPKKR
ncbi:MAG: DUF1648 domain-containing protein [Saprospiraceae bacterium]|nr:DUF1648 domain-containing protein [Saprospiraceae bacterium]